MNWVTIVLMVLAGLIAWALWKYYSLDRDEKAALKRRLGFFSVLLVLAISISGGEDTPLLEEAPPVEAVITDYPIILSGDQITRASGYLADALGEEDTWRENVVDFLNITNQSNNSTNLSF